MAVSAKVYGLAQDHITDADIDWTADTIKVSLHTSTYTPNQDTHDFFDDATNELTTTGGYTAGGVTLTTPTRTYDGATNTIKLDADDVSWTSATFTARYAVIRKARGGASSADELIAYVDFGGDETVSSGTFTITWAAGGIITLSTA